jgi:hypothetical protein
MGTTDDDQARPDVVPFTRLCAPRTPLRLETHRPGQLGREALEAFIQAVFARSYAASIRQFYPHLLALRRPDEGLAAVAGLRPAHAGGLFCETYLDTTVETLLAQACGRQVCRRDVVEIGNLAPASVGQARWLIATLTAYLHGAGFGWVVFTAVPALHNAFLRMGLRPMALADADPARLAASEQGRWGRYYDGRPVVYAGQVRQGYQALDQAVGPHQPLMERLWQDALCRGRADRAGFGTTPLAEAG